MSVAPVKPLVVAIPSKRILEAAKTFANYDWLATFTEDVTTDAVINHTAFQLMQVIGDLDKTLKNLPGMENVGKEVAQCVKPLLDVTDQTEQDDLSALFGITPNTIDHLKKEGEKVVAGLDEAIQQIRDKDKKHGEIDNYQTVYYMLLVMVRYRPKEKLFDFVYGYSYERDTSVWQWLRSANLKTKQLLALQANVLARLGYGIKERANDKVLLLEEDLDTFKELLE
ncbi:hypothetical protein BC937DRAFT_91372 [Endogone sp. FLAS-F59071]|nr:hypothetical protein BC937DRAFT_91372 [Endogone sp. FLAS-F59071]|eukprot:RUS16308.1 hypothetical protein BC937DRAFT_91372 [Endogone sp. FLAS-F59071]